MFKIKGMSSAKRRIHELLTALRMSLCEPQDSQLSLLDMNQRFCQGLSCAAHFS